MENKIHLYELDCYKNATKKQLEHMQRKADSYFDLEALPSESLQNEMRRFLVGRGKMLAIASMEDELRVYRLLSRFILERELHLKSFRQKPIAQMEKRIKAWLLQNGYLISYKTSSKVYDKKPADPPCVTLWRKIYRFLEPEDKRKEQEKDIWVLQNLDLPIRQHPNKVAKTLNFTSILQPQIREEGKAAIYMELRSVAVGTVQGELRALKRFSSYLKERWSEVDSLQKVDREIIEEYLLYLNTEVKKKSFRTELIGLKTVLAVVGKLKENPALEDLFLPGDIGREARTLYRVYSDAEMVRLNRYIVELDEQIARALLIHQMTHLRISDTLNLSLNCIYEYEGRYILRIRQLKSGYYEKPISNEAAELIKKAAKYTKDRFGEVKYLFTSEKDPGRPYQYSMIQYQVMAMIREHDLRDDNGNLFGFHTHMYRHTYGQKLAELNVDDIIIAKLLGHANTHTVRHYRKLSNTVLARETADMRAEMDRLLMDIVKGWEDFGEIHQYGELE